LRFAYSFRRGERVKGASGEKRISLNKVSAKNRKEHKEQKQKEKLRKVCL
jgi:hypothetical protein